LEIVSPETAYILGLLQDVGILVLAHAHGEHYAGILQRAREIPLLRLEYLEREDFGASHAEVSAALLQKWGLPESLVSMVVGHHAEPREGASEVEAAFLRVTRIGEAVADLADRPAPRRFLALNRLLSHYGVDRASQCRASLAEGVARALESSRLFNMPLPDDEALAQLLREIDSQVQYDAALLTEPSEPTPEAAPPMNRSETAPAGADDGEAESRKRRILVIDDEAQIVRLIRHFVSSLGLEVLACSAGDDAERLAPGVDLILCDVPLGAENGIDLVRRLRDRGYGGPVLMVSGDRNRSTVQESIDSGISGYLIKPFGKSLLLEKLRRHLALEDSEAVAPTCA
jgi:CheY-like chemotaxis protein